MMKWNVLKTGMEQFDALHAYGLGLLVAIGCRTTVVLRDRGVSYQLSSVITTIPHTSVSLLDEVFSLPLSEDIRLCEQQPMNQRAYSIQLLDGLLAALYTHPKIRLFSVSELFQKEHFSSGSIEQRLSMVSEQIHRWKVFAQKRERGDEGWLANVLKDYEPGHAVAPVFVQSTSKSDEPHLLLTLDASCGYSLRRMRSDGEMLKKTNLSVQGTCYAAILAFLGASRFLRAQRVLGKHILFSVPLMTTLVLNSETIRPQLASLSYDAERAVVWQWLTEFLQPTEKGSIWKALSYHIMQTQGMQQSLSLEQQTLSFSWLYLLEKQGGSELLWHWKAQLSYEEGKEGKKRSGNEQEGLLSFLRSPCMQTWEAYLREHTLLLCSQKKSLELWVYSLEEMRTITAMMHSSNTTPLKEILQREEGILHVGRALRNLSQSKYSARARDLIDLLEAVQTPVQFLKALYQIIQTCEVAKAESILISVPTERDLQAIHEEMDRYPIPVIAGVLMVLSTVHYPPTQNLSKYRLSTFIQLLLALNTQMLFPEEQGEGVLPIEMIIADSSKSMMTPEKGRANDDDSTASSV